MATVNLRFRSEQNSQFIVTAEFHTDPLHKDHPVITETVYDHEDSFLKQLICADLPSGTTQQLVIAAVLAVSSPKLSSSISVNITPEQNVMLGLDLVESGDITQLPLPSKSELCRSREVSFPFTANAPQFCDFLMNAPTPFAMLTGPQHVVTFINLPYMRILGRTSQNQFLGLPAREAIPELVGQPCLSLLDKAYQTGLPQIRKDMASSFRDEDTEIIHEVYFDIVYYPVRDGSGEVSGVMAQATDVTDRVLSRQVSEHREQKLYRLWAELETIYSAAPVGIAVIDAFDMKLLRVNKLQAEFFGDTSDALVDSILIEGPTLPRGLRNLLSRATSGEIIANVILESSTQPNPLRSGWLVNIRPSLNPAGIVETLTLITLNLNGNIEKYQVSPDMVTARVS